MVSWTPDAGVHSVGNTASAAFACSEILWPAACLDLRTAVFPVPTTYYTLGWPALGAYFAPAGGLGSRCCHFGELKFQGEKDFRTNTFEPFPSTNTVID